MSDKKRVDVAMVERGLAPSREKAQAYIMSGSVYSNEQKIIKPSEKITDIETITIRSAKMHPYVGRGGLKLEKALKIFQVDVAGKTCMDIGAATGGFTDVLLQNGAAHVFAIDVGYGQLDLKIRDDERVTVLERTNARYLTQEQINGQIPEITVMDVSFISVKLILPVAASLMKNSGIFCILIKPQFEAGKDKVGKRGVVRDPEVHSEIIKDIREFCSGIDYAMTGIEFSPIKGPAGNIEYLALIKPLNISNESLTDQDIEQIVSRAKIRLSCNV